MANIVIPFAAVTLQPIPTVGFNNNFTEVADKFNAYAVQTDVAKTVVVAHTWSVAQTWSAAQSFPGLTLTGDQLFTDALYDIGKTGATRPRDGFFSRNVTIGATLTAATLVGALAASSLTGTALPAGIITSSLQTFGTLAGDVLFTDALYDIGKSGANRPRDGFFSRNLTVVGVTTVLKLKGGSAAPAIVANANLGGGGAAVAIVGSDTAGKCTLTNGSGAVGGIQATVTFNAAYATVPYVIICWGTPRADFLYVTGTTTAGFNIYVNAPLAGTYDINYAVIA